MNAVTLIGNAGNEVEIRDFENGKKASFSLATNERFQKGNEEITRTEWHKVTAWGPLADLCKGIVQKGKFLKVEGKITYRQYTNKENQKVYLTEIQAFKVEEFRAKTA